MGGNAMVKAQGNTGIEEFPAFNPSLESWESLVSTAHEVTGFDLIKDENADALVNVPFVITRVTYRPGLMRDGVLRYYVSCECVIAPADVIQRRGVMPERLPFEPGDLVVFNDGSTGVYRQITGYLAALGYIVLPQGPEQGHYGESILDSTPEDWIIQAGDERTNEDHPVYAANIRLYCKRGLRISEYENEYTQTGKTRYIG